MDEQNPDVVPLTAADIDRFHRNAWAAVRRREGTFVLDEIGAGLRAVILGGVPLIGLLLWNWSALQLLMFYFVGSWIGILCDLAKLRCLEKEIMAWGNAYYEDWHVWVVVDALRVGEKHAARSHLRAKYKPWSGVFVDFAFGGLSTLLMCIGLIRSPTGIQWNELGDPKIILWLAAVSVYQIVFTVWEIWDQKSSSAHDRKVTVAVGLRGVGLFLFMFLLVYLTDGFKQSGPGVVRAMVAVNGLIVVWGIVTMAGPLWMAKETRWLRAYLQQRDAESTA